jgi:hypothetical protein
MVGNLVAGAKRRMVSGVIIARVPGWVHCSVALGLRCGREISMRMPQAIEKQLARIIAFGDDND